MKKSYKLSIVTPMFNESESISAFIETMKEALSKLTENFEIVCINDGSRDSTLQELKQEHRKDIRIKIVSFSRNFGKEVALTAGLNYASGDAVIPMDCDLQDPPELIGQMIEKWQEGYDVVLGKRVDRSSDGAFKRQSASWFYKLLGSLSDIKIPENVGDFRLMDKRVVDQLKLYPERNRFMKGIFASLGFKQYEMDYVRPKRHAGETKFNLLKLYKLAIEGVVSFSSLPLKIWSYLGFMISLGSMFYGIVLIFKTLFWGIDVPGYASLMVTNLIMSGIMLMGIGIVGEYIARIFIEVKARPLYIISETLGFSDDGN